MIEVLDETQPWPIDIGPPEEPPRDRRIEAVKDGAVVASWRWSKGAWYDPTSFARDWQGIVQTAIGSGWMLRSVPVVDPSDAAAAAAARKHHANVGMALTETGKGHWRAVFRAGLDAYLAAGGGR